MQKYSSPNDVTGRFVQLYGKRKLAEFNRYADVLASFRRYFGHGSAYLCSSPGRAELIGNHLDHNGGKVIAFTVDLDIVAAFCDNGSDAIRIVGKNRNMISVSVNDDAPCGRSAGLVKGVVRYLREHGFAAGGFDAYTDSAVPSGAGVSSSAAFELTVGKIVSALFNGESIPAEVLARAGQYAENVYFGKPCGLLDQSVIAVGGAVQLDFADDLRYETLPTAFGGVSFALINTGASHSRLSDLYAAIPADMQAVAARFGKRRLIEVSPDEFFADYRNVERDVGERAVLRAKHFYEELARVEKMSNLIRATRLGNADTIAAAKGNADFVRSVLDLINDSGASSLAQLKNCAVDDNDTAIADIISFAHQACPCGARVHGGGFAGTVLCAVPSEYFANFISAATARYGADKVYSLSLRPVGTTIL